MEKIEVKKVKDNWGFYLEKNLIKKLNSKWIAVYYDEKEHAIILKGEGE